MTSHSLRTESLLKLAWPIFLQNATNSLVMFVDFLFFSYLSDEVAGVIGQLLPIFWVGAFVIPVFAGTGISVASQFIGANRQEKVVPTYMTNVLMSLTLGAGFSVFLIVFAGDLGRWIGMSPGQTSIGGEYFSVIGYYFFFMSILVAYNAILSSRGMTHWLMYSAFMVAVVNVSLNSLFVFVFGWEVRGIALASVVGVGMAMVLSMLLAHRILKIRFYLKGAWADMKGVLRPMIRIGVSNALEPFSYTAQQIVLATFIVALGVTAMATHSYGGRAQMFQITFGFSLANAAQILMAHWVGARRFADVHQLFWRALRAATFVALTYSVLLWFFADPVLSIFTDDPAIKALGKSVLFVSIFLEPARAVNIIGGFCLRTVGDARFPLIVGIAFIWGILPVIFLIDRFWGLGLVGLWTCFAIDEIIRAVINIWRWQTGKWKSMGFAHD